MRSADISMLIAIHMDIKQSKRYILQTVLFFFNIDFQRSKGGSTFFEKKSKPQISSLWSNKVPGPFLIEKSPRVQQCVMLRWHIVI